MPFIRTVSEHEADGRLEHLYAGSRAREGSVAHIVQLMSLDARSAVASIGFYGSLMKSDNALSPARREMLATVVSNVNECFY